MSTATEDSNATRLAFALTENLSEMSIQASPEDVAANINNSAIEGIEPDDLEIRPAPPAYARADPNPNQKVELAETINEEPPPSKKKGLRFALAFIALSVVAFTSALDATILAVALPVCILPQQLSFC